MISRWSHNTSLKLNPEVHLWFVGRLTAGVRFALVIWRGYLLDVASGVGREKR